MASRLMHQHRSGPSRRTFRTRTDTGTGAIGARLAGMRALREIWPVLMAATLLSVASVWVIARLDRDRASIPQDRYERFMDGTRGV